MSESEKHNSNLAWVVPPKQKLFSSLILCYNCIDYNAIKAGFLLPLDDYTNDKNPTFHQLIATRTCEKGSKKLSAVGVIIRQTLTN